MSDLAAIVARDAVTTYPTTKAQLNAALQALQDRRALLALLRETRDALGREHPRHGSYYACGTCDTYARLAALDTETPA